MDKFPGPDLPHLLSCLQQLMPLICWISLLFGFALLGGRSASVLQIQHDAVRTECAAPHFEANTDYYQWCFQIQLGAGRTLRYSRVADWPLPLASLLHQLSGSRTADRVRTA